MAFVAECRNCFQAEILAVSTRRRWNRILVHSTSHHGMNLSQRSTGNLVLLLTINQGRSRFPDRPVLGERFLIGGSPSCDLCLSAPEMPPLHSLIVNSGREYHWETMMSDPVVRHNDRVREFFALNEGDHVSIGEITFDVRLRPLSEIAERLGVDPQTLSVNGPADECPGIGELGTSSAANLVNRLERDMRWIEQVDRRRQMGADAVLHTVKRQIAVSEQSNPLIEEPRLLERLEHLVSQLARFTDGLQRRAGETAAGRRNLAASLETVLDEEWNLTDRIDTLVHGLTSPDDSNRSAA